MIPTGELDLWHWEVEHLGPRGRRMMGDGHGVCWPQTQTGGVDIRDIQMRIADNTYRHQPLGPRVQGGRQVDRDDKPRDRALRQSSVSFPMGGRRLLNLCIYSNVSTFGVRIEMSP